MNWKTSTRPIPKPKVMHVRMRELRLGDTILTPRPLHPNLIDTITVRTLRLIGDDVDVNDDALTSSMSNLVTIIAR